MSTRDSNALTVLLVEDDLRIRAEIAAGLETAGYRVELCDNGRAGIERILGHDYAVVVLDLMLPARDGYDVLEAVAGRSSTPIIVLTARTDIDARVRSFELGAVDYLAKPFFMRELLARVEARLGRRLAPARRIAWADVVLDLDARRVTRAGERVPLTAHEFNVLAWLIERPGRALSRGYIADNALPEHGERNDRTVDTHMSRIRAKLGPRAAASLATVWGIGYRFDRPTE